MSSCAQAKIEVVSKSPYEEKREKETGRDSRERVLEQDANANAE
jgi:hypothetical protein